jgi:hypothetical protein
MSHMTIARDSDEREFVLGQNLRVRILTSAAETARARTCSSGPSCLNASPLRSTRSF